MGVSPLLYTQPTKKQMTVLQQGPGGCEHRLVPNHPRTATSFSGVLDLSLPLLLSEDRVQQPGTEPSIPSGSFAVGSHGQKNTPVTNKRICHSNTSFITPKLKLAAP